MNRSTFSNLFLLPLLTGLLACSSNKSQETKPTSTGQVSTSAVESEQVFDTAFLVESCSQTGITQEQCKCAADRAGKSLGGELLAKMKAAPSDDDPKIDGYYSDKEIGKIMSWIEKSSTLCKIDDSEEIAGAEK